MESVSSTPPPKTGKNIGDLLREFREHRDAMRMELSKAIVGQDDVIEQLFAAIFTRGHCLLEGVPGLAKTLMVATLAKILDVQFKRVQFTPDLMPSDITGTNVLDEDQQGKREFRFVEGPIFTNILLADEINRTPPRHNLPCCKRCKNEKSRRPTNHGPARPILYDRNAEPNRAGRDLPSSRSPIGSIHVQHQGGIPHSG